MFRNIAVAEYTRKIIIIPYNIAVHNQLSKLYVPRDVVLVLVYDFRCKSPWPVIQKLVWNANPLLDHFNFDRIQILYKNVIVCNADTNNSDVYGLLLGYFSSFKVPIYCRFPTTIKSELYNEIFNLFHFLSIKSNLYHLIFDMPLDSQYLTFREFLYEPKLACDFKSFSVKNVSHFLSRLLQSHSLICNFDSFQLKANNYYEFIQSASHSSSSLLRDDDYPRSLINLKEFNDINFKANKFQAIIYNSSDNKILGNSISIGEYTFQSCLFSCDNIAKTASLANLFISQLLINCFLKFKYFQGFKFYLDGVFGLNHDPALYIKCFKLAASNDFFFSPSKYVQLASQYLAKHNAGNLEFTFTKNDQRFGYFSCTLTISSLKYSNHCNYFISKSKCRQNLAKQFCTQYAVLKFMYDSNSNIIQARELNIPQEDLRERINALPCAQLSIPNSKKRKQSNNESDIILKRLKKSIVVPAGLTNHWKNEESQSKIQGLNQIQLNNWHAKPDRKIIQPAVTNSMVNSTERMLMCNKDTRLDNLKTFQDQEKTLKNPKIQNATRLEFQKTLNFVKQDSFNMNLLSKIEVGLLYRLYIIKYPMEYTNNFEYLKKFVNVEWETVCEKEKLEYWRYTLAIKMAEIYKKIINSK
eukprot:NODE_14_length_42432_cov_0.433799.p4 type:complete len:640 gc:universal NODE_14_length_42432_cov_0.433799:17984-19903(+)